VLANVVAAIEQHVDWIGDCLSYVREHGWRTIEADVHAQAEWVEHAQSLVVGLVRTAPSCSSWYLGANVSGKRRIFLPYTGGLPAYRRRCDEVADAGYDSFVLA
jgi:cyclohexanone monooxygenase